MGSTVKTAISLPGELLEQVNAYAKEFHQSRTAVVRDALEALLNAYQDRKILIKARQIYAEINKVDEALSEEFFSISSKPQGDKE